MAKDVQRRQPGGVRPLHTLALVVGGVVAVIVAFVVLGFVASLVWTLVKVVVLVALLAGALWLVFGRRR